MEATAYKKWPIAIENQAPNQGKYGSLHQSGDPADQKPVEVFPPLLLAFFCQWLAQLVSFTDHFHKFGIISLTPWVTSSRELP